MSTPTAEPHATNVDHDHHSDDGAVHAHISDTKFLVGIFAALIVLTVITVAVSRVDLGSANTFVAIAVATTKAALVATFFMHLRHDRPFNAVILVAAFVFLGIFIAYSMNDISTRGIVDRANGVTRWERNGEQAPGGFTVRGSFAHGGEHGGGEHGDQANQGARSTQGEHGTAAPAGDHGGAAAPATPTAGGQAEAPAAGGHGGAAH